MIWTGGLPHPIELPHLPRIPHLHVNRPLAGNTTTLHVHLTFLSISLPFLLDHDAELPKFTFYWGRKQRTAKFYSLLNLNLFFLETPGRFLHIWQSKWVRIFAIKTERTQIHFWSDVFAAVSSSDRKVPSESEEHAVSIFLKSNCLPLLSLFCSDCIHLLYDSKRQTAPASILNDRTRSFLTNLFIVKGLNPGVTSKGWVWSSGWT